LVVAGKIEAAIVAARHFQRHGAATAGDLIARLSEYAARLPEIGSNEQLLGLEGAAASAWFDLFGRLFVSPWSFPGRVRRPPTDPLNALLSLGYTWLLGRATARAEARGYEIYLGGLHEYRPGRPSLSCDLIEPLRVPAVDRWAVNVCNQAELTPDVFRLEENGGFRLLPKWFGRTLYSWESFWVNSNLEPELEGWLDRLNGLLKRWDTPQPGEDSGPDDL
jgi:CRISPR-associated protein Cas1